MVTDAGMPPSLAARSVQKMERPCASCIPYSRYIHTTVVFCNSPVHLIAIGATNMITARLPAWGKYNSANDVSVGGKPRSPVCRKASLLVLLRKSFTCHGAFSKAVWTWTVASGASKSTAVAGAMKLSFSAVRYEDPDAFTPKDREHTQLACL